MNEMKRDADTLPSGSDLVITRRFDASREVVWKAWTVEEAVKRWWGPKEHTAPSCTIDLRVDGKFLFCMRSPEGKEFWSTGTYREIVPLERLVYSDSFADEEGNIVPASYYGMDDETASEMLVTVTLAEQGGQTEMTLRHTGLPAGSMGEMAEQGWKESIDKLALSLGEGTASATTLAKQDERDDSRGTPDRPPPTKKRKATKSKKLNLVAEPGKQEIVITRIFDAPREVVFKACTDPNLIPQWWGPRNLTTTVDTMDARPGGSWRFVHRAPDGSEYAFHGVYHAIVPPERVVNTMEFEGMPGHVVMETVTFEDQGGKTKLTVKSVFQSVEDRDGMLMSGMETGASESYDRLEELLSVGA